MKDKRQALIFQKQKGIFPLHYKKKHIHYFTFSIHIKNGADKKQSIKINDDLKIFINPGNTR